MSQQPRQQVQLNPLQLLQITSEVLGQLKEWAEKKAKEPQAHKEHDMTAVSSLHHARLLCNIRLREIMIEIQERQRQSVPAKKPDRPNEFGRSAAQADTMADAKTLEALWDQMGIRHYLDTGRP